MHGTKDKVKVLFLCTGNSCRSQMAEGWANHLKGDVIDTYSAGVCPSAVNPRTIKVMAEVGVDISAHTCKHVDELLAIDFDYVVTLCDRARQQCPIFNNKAKLIHKAFEDPTLVVGDEKEVLAGFRKTRDDIRKFVEKMPEILEGKDK